MIVSWERQLHTRDASHQLIVLLDQSMINLLKLKVVPARLMILNGQYVFICDVITIVCICHWQIRIFVNSKKNYNHNNNVSFKLKYFSTTFFLTMPYLKMEPNLVLIFTTIIIIKTVLMYLKCLV